MKNYDTKHGSKCAATYRAQLMLNRCGDNRYRFATENRRNILVLRHNKLTSCRNTHVLTFSGIYGIFAAT